MSAQSSSHRRTRSRREAGLSATPDDVPDSGASTSQSRGAKRRKTGADAEEVHEPVRTSDSLVNAVIASLNMPMKIEAATQYANDKNAREHKEGIQAYAKLAGATWTYYVRDLKITIGRPPDVRSSHTSSSQNSPSQQRDAAVPVDINLGPNKIISRLHAIIQYDSNQKGTWQMNVLGRNGAKVDEKLVEKGTVDLRSGTIIDIGGVQMMFVLPDQPPYVDPRFIPMGYKEYDRPSSFSFPKINFPMSSFSGQPGETAEKKEESAYARGLMLETTDIVDYSQDSAKDLKPPLSYAALIARAILSSPEQKLTLNSIYSYITENYAFYRHAATGWQNSIRHNLSLNKAFEKIPRRTDEPGKGMKWQIVPEMKEEYIRKLARPSTRGHRNTSSVPPSPASELGRSKQQSSFLSSLPLDSSPQGQPINQLRKAAATASTSLSLEDSEDIRTSSLPVKKSTRSVTPPLRFGVQPVEAYTPDRGSRLPMLKKPSTLATPIASSAAAAAAAAAADSGLPPSSPAPAGLAGAYNRSGLASNENRTTITTAMSPPARVSPYPDDQPTLAAVTPAPQRQHPRLAPPSAGQLPSSYLPTSSPAPFWKYAGWNGNGDFTPSKDLHSSSPPPAPQTPIPPSASQNVAESALSRSRALGSPIRSPIRDKDKSHSTNNNHNIMSKNGPNPLDLDPTNTLKKKSEDQQQKLHQGGPPPSLVGLGGLMDDDEDDGLGDLQGVDLTKGFQKIGQFHLNGGKGLGKDEGWDA